jgi:hypothetical protein
MPDIPMCLKHALRVAAAVQRRVDQIEAAGQPAPEVARDGRRYAPDAEGLVYYLRVGSLIKIGYSAKFGARMNSYPPNAELLGQHAGTRADEEALHARFAAHRAQRREWYHPAPELMTHIERVQAENAREATVKTIRERKRLESRAASGGRA